MISCGGSCGCGSVWWKIVQCVLVVVVDQVCDLLDQEVPQWLFLHIQGIHVAEILDHAGEEDLLDLALGRLRELTSRL